MSPTTDIVDAFSTEQYQNDPHPYLERLRETDPVHRSPRSGFVYITRHADSTKLLRSPMFGRDLRRWNSPYNIYRAENAHRDPTAAILGAALQPWMLNHNPPDHTRIRKVFAHAFVPAAIGQMAKAVAHETSRALAELPAQGSVELISAFALPLPGRIVGRIFDVPERDSDQLAAWSQAIMLSQSPVASLGVKHAAKRALDAFQRYMAAFVAQRRARPGEGLVDRAIAAERIEGAISEQELLVNILGILLAGHETSSALIGNGLLTLLQHPAQLERLRADSSLMPAAIEELLRFEPPSTITPRVALEATELAGVPIAAGELCWTVHAAVNRDPEVFALPQQLDIARAPNPHQSFGAGIHHCIGASLARLTVQSALLQLFERYPQISLADARPVWRAGVSTRALARLSLWVGK